MITVTSKEVSALLNELQKRIDWGHSSQGKINDSINEMKSLIREEQARIRGINDVISPLCKAKSDLAWAHGISNENTKDEAIKKAISNAKGIISNHDMGV